VSEPQEPTTTGATSTAAASGSGALGFRTALTRQLAGALAIVVVAAAGF
jgi:hypothetical protein